MPLSSEQTSCRCSLVVLTVVTFQSRLNARTLQRLSNSFVRRQRHAEGLGHRHGELQHDLERRLGGRVQTTGLDRSVNVVVVVVVHVVIVVVALRPVFHSCIEQRRSIALFFSP